MSNLPDPFLIAFVWRKRGLDALIDDENANSERESHCEQSMDAMNGFMMVSEAKP
jgi:hypothetical protein